ncbi:hypothetical protein GC175_30685 [bacterium]|nr:hypothetical protein [bacterium]
MSLSTSDPKALSGVAALIAQTSALAARYDLTRRDRHRFVLAFAERFAYIRVQDMWNPWRFLSQMEGAPPVRLGTDGFKHALVDDANPARHYAAFVFVGYWLPPPLAVLMLWAWEIAGFVRYADWSQPDMRSGYVGLFHGRLVRRYSHTILPALMARDLTEVTRWSRLSDSGAKVVGR